MDLLQYCQCIMLLGQSEWVSTGVGLYLPKKKGWLKLLGIDGSMCRLGVDERAYAYLPCSFS